MTHNGPQSEQTVDLHSVHTSNLPELFEQFQISLIVSTYQAGKAIVVRNDNGTLNTHFRTFAKPMGIVADQDRLTIGGANTVWDYRNIPAVAKKLEPQVSTTPAICRAVFMHWRYRHPRARARRQR